MYISIPQTESVQETVPKTESVQETVPQNYSVQDFTSDRVRTGLYFRLSLYNIVPQSLQNYTSDESVKDCTSE